MMLAIAKMSATARMPATRKDASKNYLQKQSQLQNIPAKNVIDLKQIKN